MWIDSKIYLNDLNKIISDKNIDWNAFKNKRILVTGATGLIGSLIVNTLLYLNKVSNFDIKVFALVRNEEKAKKLFNTQFKSSLNLKIFVADICNPIFFDEELDYIIHAASETSSQNFVNNPIETINVILNGTKNLLDLCKNKRVKDFIFLSTMEIYGRQQEEKKIKELSYTKLNSMEVRECYPIAKVMAENLCICFCNEYNLHCKILRLTQTFGPGVFYYDNRVFAEFARAVIEKKDIILNTLGETKRNYLYTADAVKAIFTVLQKGRNQEAYNVANENSYCSIYEMAKLVAEKCANGKINVICNPKNDIKKYGYADTLKMNLDTEKLRSLGWNAEVELEDMFKNMILAMEQGG